MNKVCHMTSAHDSYDVRIFYKECSSLAHAGYDTYLVACGKNREENGVHVVGIGDAPANRLSRMTFFAKKIYEQAQTINADIYHLHDPELLPYGLKLKKSGKKVIFDSHENYPVQILEKSYIPKWSRSIAFAAYKRYETSCVRKLDSVIVPCTFDGVNIFKNRARQTYFVANYPKINEICNKYNENRETNNYICYVGTITYSRGIFHLIKATYASEKRLLLIGSFSDPDFEKSLRSMPEFSCVDYLGQIPNTKVAETIQHCFAGINTILNIGQYHHIDTFGVKVFEYMSLGLPVIMPDYPYTQAMVNRYKFGICVKSDDIQAISNAIRYLYDHQEEAQHMGENGHRAIQKEFNWETQEKVLLSLYKNLVEKK